MPEDFEEVGENVTQFNLAITQLQQIGGLLSMISHHNRNKNLNEWYSSCRALKNLIVAKLTKQELDRLNGIEKLINFCINNINDTKTSNATNKKFMATAFEYVDKYNIQLMLLLDKKGFLIPMKQKNSWDLFSGVDD